MGLGFVCQVTMISNMPTELQWKIAQSRDIVSCDPGSYIKKAFCLVIFAPAAVGKQQLLYALSSLVQLKESSWPSYLGYSLHLALTSLQLFSQVLKPRLLHVSLTELGLGPGFQVFSILRVFNDAINIRCKALHFFLVFTSGMVLMKREVFSAY